MAEGRVDDEMIEIGDPTEEPTSGESAPRVVIEYHERGGVPWMLIPPLLVLSAVGAILALSSSSPHAPTSLSPATGEAPKSSPARVVVEPELAASPVATPSRPEPRSRSEAGSRSRRPRPPSSRSPPSLRSSRPKWPTQPRSPGSKDSGSIPKALEAERKVEAPADPALAPVGREARPDDRDLPREIDPDLLPPDPQLARQRQQQRKVEQAKKIEDERTRFHAELKAVCRKFGDASAPEILETDQELRRQGRPEGRANGGRSARGRPASSSVRIAGPGSTSSAPSATPSPSSSTTST